MMMRKENGMKKMEIRRGKLAGELLMQVNEMEKVDGNFLFLFVSISLCTVYCVPLRVVCIYDYYSPGFLRIGDEGRPRREGKLKLQCRQIVT